MRAPDDRQTRRSVRRPDRDTMRSKGLINVADLTFTAQNSEADTAVAGYDVEMGSLVSDTGSALPRHRARCNRKPGNGTSIRGYFGAASALRFKRVSPSA
jgi:hypothetical protein